LHWQQDLEFLELLMHVLEMREDGLALTGMIDDLGSSKVSVRMILVQYHIHFHQSERMWNPHYSVVLISPIPRRLIKSTEAYRTK
jgi:hypothetical protein